MDGFRYSLNPHDEADNVYGEPDEEEAECCERKHRAEQAAEQHAYALLP